MGQTRMKYPIGVQDFEKLRQDGYVYVDKTRQIYEIATHGNYYFLGRPRRFGKSLLLSTLEAYFLGKKELFEGLAIEKLEEDWAEYPVLRLDLNTGEYLTERGLEEVLNVVLTEWERLYGKSDVEITSGMRFSGIIKRAYEKTGRQVVILVDEYDKPLLNTFDNLNLQELYRSQLKVFYSVLKTQDRYIRFAFLTGVTKFGKVSVFSDLNNLNDISMDRRYADICGITEQELHENFEPSIRQLADSAQSTYEDMCLRLKERYDGYHFCADSIGVYNPFSLLKTFDSGELGDWWFETGTPTFLVQLLQDNDCDLNRLQHGEIMAEDITKVDNVERNPVPMLYQSGYLTIAGADKEFGTYILDFPNKEVESGFIKFILPYYANDRSGNSKFTVTQFVRDVRNGDAEGFMSRLQTFLEDGDYRISGKMEIYFQNVLFVIFKMMGLYTSVERTTARGRADIVIETTGYVYIIECKLDGSSDEALQQIEECGYAKPYDMDERKLFKIGVNFSSEIRGIKEWKMES